MSSHDHPDAEMLRKLLEYSGLPSVSQIAKATGLAASTLTRVFNNKTAHRLGTPTMDRLRETYPGFFNEEDNIGPDLVGYLPVEVMPSYAGMGGGGAGGEEVQHALIPRRLIEDKLHAHPKDLLLIECRGDSMAPDFAHGDQILVDKRDTDPVQPGPFVLWDGDGYVLKLVERVPQKRGWLRIFSINDRYREYEVDVEQVRIMGRPVWFAREL